MIRGRSGCWDVGWTRRWVLLGWLGALHETQPEGDILFLYSGNRFSCFFFSPLSGSTSYYQEMQKGPWLAQVHHKFMHGPWWAFTIMKFSSTETSINKKPLSVGSIQEVAELCFNGLRSLCHNLISRDQFRSEYIDMSKSRVPSAWLFSIYSRQTRAGKRCIESARIYNGWEEATESLL